MQGRKIFRVTTLLRHHLTVTASFGAKLHRGDITVAPTGKAYCNFQPTAHEMNSTDSAFCLAPTGSSL